MNQETIPDNNLPVYLQQYNVKILNVDIPECLIGGCQGTEFGCCCDKITPAIDASGSNCIGGCCGTQFGCCPYSTEAKIDLEGSNCGTIAGSVLYTTVGAIPSNVALKRVWDLNLTGYLKPNRDKYYIVYDFSEVNYKEKDRITFEDKLSGTFNICGRVLDASKVFDYKFCDVKLTLTIIIDTNKWDFRLKKEVLFSYQLNVNDNESTFSCPTGDNYTCQKLPSTVNSNRILYYQNLNKTLSFPSGDDVTVNYVSFQFDDITESSLNIIQMSVGVSIGTNNQCFLQGINNGKQIISMESGGTALPVSINQSKDCASNNGSYSFHIIGYYTYPYLSCSASS